MAKLPRVTQKIFAQNSDTKDVTVFGTAKNGNDAVFTKDISQIMNSEAFSQGWGSATLTDDAPFQEDMNGVQLTLSQQLAYFFENGMPEWDENTTYYANTSFCQVNGVWYQSLTDNNIGNNPVNDTTNWYKIDLDKLTPDLSNLSATGLDKLNQSKALETGSVSSDADVYADVQKYAHSTFDQSKFTVVGSPNITNDGIASGFTGTSYISFSNIISLNVPSFIIKCKFTTGASLDNNQYVFNSNGGVNGLRFGIVNGKWNFVFLTSDDNVTTLSNSSESLQINTTYYAIVSFDGTKYTLKISLDNKNWIDIYTSESSELLKESTYNWQIGAYSGSNTFQGVIDLKYFSIIKENTLIVSGNKTGIDVIKPDNYEVVGTPTISDDGIASGFLQDLSTDYNSSLVAVQSTIKLGELQNKSWKICIGFTMPESLSDFPQTLFSFSQSAPWASYCGSPAVNTNGTIKIDDSFGTSDNFQNDVTIQSSQQYSAYGLELGKKYTYVREFNNNTGAHTYSFLKDGETIWSKDYTPTTENKGNKAINSYPNEYINLGSACMFYNTNFYCWGGTIDLNAFKVYVDGSLIYQPCLKIPYTESKTGSKIVDAAYRDRVLDLYEQYGYAPYYTIYEENQNFTLPMGEIYGMIERKSSGGGGLEIGDIGIAPLGVDESKGLRRYLNGSIMNINSNTQAFVDKLKSTAVVFPALTCTEEEWQSIVSSSALGQCGKFVIDETAGTVRLPKVVKLQGCLTLANISDIVDAQLPDIEFNMRAIHYGNNNGGLPDGNPLADGAAQASNQVSRMTTSGTTSAIYGADFNIKASRSSSVYEADATVQEEAVQYPYFIQIATGVENEVNITNEIELNNPYTLFESKYVQASLYNSSWLLSNGTFYSKSVYVTAYEALNVEYNSEVTAGTTVTLPSGGSYTKRGLPVKLSTDEYTDYDFVINRSNETFRLPLKNGMEGVLADTIVSNGQVIKLQGSSSEANLQGLAQNLNGVCANLQMTSAIGYGDLKFGSETGLTLANSNSQQAENYNLYYYVGETVQNAALINAAMLGETIPELTQKIAVCRGIPDYSQKTEFEANTTYQLNTDSMIFWYTSGATNNPATITISANSDLSSPIIYNPFYINADGHTVLTFIVPAGYYFKVSRNMTSNNYTKSFYCPLKGGN